MTTGELIEALKTADPSGELHVRMAGGIPKYVYALHGYYDGHYTYLKDDKMHYSTRGSKVDIMCWTEDEVIEDAFSDHDFSNKTKEEAWQIILGYFNIEWNKDMNPENDWKSERILKRIKEWFEIEWSYVEKEKMGN